MGLKPGPNGDRWYVCMPLYHGTGGTTGLVCMITGITCCIGTKFSTSKFWTDVRDSRSTAIVYVGETARYLINTPPSDLDKKHNVRVMYGNGLRPDVWQRFVDRFGIEVVGEFFNSTEGVMALFNDSCGPFTATSVGHQGLINRWRFHNTYVPVAVDVVTGELLWFAVPPSDLPAPPKPVHSLAYLNFHANKQKQPVVASRTFGQKRKLVDTLQGELLQIS